MLCSKRINLTSSSSRQIPSSAETIAENPDMLSEILTRLPLKSLLKFKCVSKNWLSVITDPQFRPKQRSKTLTGLFLRRPLGLKNTAYDFINLGPDSCRSPIKTLDFAPDPSGIRIMQSCNGLLLCCSFDPNQIQKNYYVFNPTTKQSTVLPPINDPDRAVIGVSLAFDPAKSPDYKVICVRNAYSDSEFDFQIEIYSPKTGPWRLSGRPFAAPFSVDFRSSVFCNGSVHWITDSMSALRFDIDDEQIRETPMPVFPGSGVDEMLYRFVGESGGYLHLIEIYASFSEPFDVYQMERDCSGWFPKFRVDLNPVADVYPDMITGYQDPIDVIYFDFAILSVIRGRDGSDEDSYMIMSLPNKAIRYNLGDQSLYQLSHFEPIEEETKNENLQEPGLYDAYPFIQSFASV